MLQLATISDLPKREPSNIEAEQIILGAVVQNNDRLVLIREILADDHFYDPMHRRIWKLLVEMIDKGLVANMVVLRNYLTAPEASGMSPAPYLESLAKSVNVKDNELTAYALDIRSQYFRRELITIAQAVDYDAYHEAPHIPPEELIARAESHLSKLRMGLGESSSYSSMSTAASGALMAAEQIYKSMALDYTGRVFGRSSGFPKLDEVMGGLQSPDMIVVAGRPGMGKTALATNIAVNVASSLAPGEGVVVIVSLEMSKEQIAHRIISERSGVPGWKFRRKQIDQYDMEKFVEAKREFEKLPLQFIDKSGLTVAEIRSRLRQIKADNNVVLVVVDYLQLIAGANERDNNFRYSLITANSGALKQIAKEFDVPIIVLSQLSRSVDYRDDKRPTMSDLKESGAIEQDADIIAMIYREEYYLRRTKPREGTIAYEKWHQQLDRCQSCADIIMAKNRHGPEGVVTLGFDANFTRFINEAPQHAKPESSDEIEERKKLGISKKAAAAFQALKTEIQMASESLTIDKVGVVKAIKYREWRKHVVTHYVDPDRSEKAGQGYLERLLTEINTAGLIAQADVSGERYVWLTSKGAQFG